MTLKIIGVLASLIFVFWLGYHRGKRKQKREFNKRLKEFLITKIKIQDGYHVYILWQKFIKEKNGPRN